MAQARRLTASEWKEQFVDTAKTMEEAKEAQWYFDQILAEENARKDKERETQLYNDMLDSSRRDQARFAGDNMFSNPSKNKFKVCIVGGGPGGIQLGYFMEQSHPGEYVVIERSSVVGSFFQWYPRQRNLISINKPYTGWGSRGFNLRHDWNSLLSFGPAGDTHGDLRFTKFSHKFYPKADKLVEYLNYFANQTAINIHFNTNVTEIRKVDDHFTLKASYVTNPPSDPHANYSKIYPLNYYHPGEEEAGQNKYEWAERVYTCGVVVDAMGRKVKKTPTTNIHFAETYETFDNNNLERFQNKTVAILGYGNAAQEIYKSIMNHAASVTIMGGDTRLSWETHYVGDIRAVNCWFLDGFQLKANDALAIKTIRGEDMVLVNTTLSGRSGIYIFSKSKLAQGKDRTGMSLDELYERIDGCKARGALVPSECDLGEDASVFMNVDEDIERTDDVLHRGSRPISQNKQKDPSRMVPPSKYHKYKLRDAENDNRPIFRDPFDVVILATGFQPDLRPFHEDTKPKLNKRKNFPMSTPEYESVNVPGLFFMGNLAHHRDFRKTSGGFIHGFRYTAHALFKILDRRMFGKPFPQETISLYDIGSKILERINDADALYQMYYSYRDVVVFDEDCSDDANATYIHDFPIDIFFESSDRFKDLTGIENPKKVISVFFNYHPDYSGIHVDTYHVGRIRPLVSGDGPLQSNFIHPLMSYHEFNETTHSHIELSAMAFAEDVFWEFNHTDLHRIPMLDYLSCLTGCDLIFHPTVDLKIPANRASPWGTPERYNLKDSVDVEKHWPTNFLTCQDYFDIYPFVKYMLQKTLTPPFPVPSSRPPLDLSKEIARLKRAETDEEVEQMQKKLDVVDVVMIEDPTEVDLL